jgi:hypothetical protein
MVPILFFGPSACYPSAILTEHDQNDPRRSISDSQIVAGTKKNVYFPFGHVNSQLGTRSALSVDPRELVLDCGQNIIEEKRDGWLMKIATYNVNGIRSRLGQSVGVVEARNTRCGLFARAEGAG